MNLGYNYFPTIIYFYAVFSRLELGPATIVVTSDLNPATPKPAVINIVKFAIFQAFNFLYMPCNSAHRRPI